LETALHTNRVHQNFIAVDGTWAVNTWSIEEASNLCFTDLVTTGQDHAIGEIVAMTFTGLPTLRNLLDA